MLRSQPPSHIHKWPQLGRGKFVHPRLTLKPVNDLGRSEEKEIALKDIVSACKQGNKPVKVLVEGVPGSGKTTISWYAC